MLNEATPWSGLHSRAAALPAERRACFALACAEHLVRAELSAREGELRAALDDGWSALSGARRDLGGRAAALAAREDLDDDEVACVAFALDAVADPDSTDATLRASMRALDAAYARVRYEQDAFQFRPLADDTEEPVVRAEFSWQADALALLEGPAALAEVVAQLRA